MLEALFKVLFTYECQGEEHVPATGPVVIAANHPSYLDPVLLSLHVRRPIRFMAWDALFKVPLLGALIRAMGAFPVDIRKGQGRRAYERAKGLVEQGEAVGIFPEGQRSQTGWMEPRLREGAARLALETGARLVPATIAGAFRAWGKHRAVPSASRVRVRFHEPIDPAAYRELPEEEAIAGLLAELRRRVERSLLPGVRADQRLDALYRQQAPWPRLFEYLPLLALAVVTFWRTRSLSLVLPAYGFIAYMLIDHALMPQSRLVKRIRNCSSPLVLMLLVRHWSGALKLPDVPAQGALLAIMVGACFPFMYENGVVSVEYLRGLVAAVVLAAAVLYYVPLSAGPHVALSVYAAAYAFNRETVFWRWAVPILLAYAATAAWVMVGLSPRLLPHALAGLVAWMVTWLLPYHRAAIQSGPEPPREGGLGLFE